MNSTAEVKALSDICCTSANAASVVRSLPQQKVIFTPDRNLGAWVKSKVPEKEIVVYDGCCPVHDVLRSASVGCVKRAKPGAVIIAHPECRADVLAMADEVCSTTAMLTAVERHPEREDLHRGDRARHRAPAEAALPGPRVRRRGRLHRLPDALPLHEDGRPVMVRDALVRGKHEIRVPGRRRRRGAPRPGADDRRPPGFLTPPRRTAVRREVGPSTASRTVFDTPRGRTYKRSVLNRIKVWVFVLVVVGVGVWSIRGRSAVGSTRARHRSRTRGSPLPPVSSTSG